MGTKSFSNYADLITFSRASGGTALRPVSYGSELVTNGTFDSDVSGWSSNNSSLSAVSGRLRLTQQGAGLGFAQTTFATVVGKVYRLAWDYVAGTAPTPTTRVATSTLGSNIASTASTDASITFVAQSTTTYVNFRMATTTDGLYSEFDNVSVKEVLFDQPDGTLTLFNHPDNTPRIEYDADGNRLGLLIEEQRTNLFTYSEDFSNAAWTKSATSVTANDIESPDKQDNGYKVQSTSGGVASNVNETVSKTANTDYTFSVFVKKGNVDRVVVGQQITGAYSNNIYDFSTDTWTTTGSGSPTLKSESVGNGWYRLSVTMDAGATTGNYQNWVGPLDSDATSHLDTTSGNNVYIYGAQLEAGSFPTSYIPTSGSTATRAADVASIPVSDFGYNQSEGTVVLDAQNYAGNTGDPHAFTLSDGTTSNRIRIDINDGNKFRITVVSAGATQVLEETSFADYANPYKASMAFSTNDFAGYINGGSPLSDSSGVIPTVDTLFLGADAVGTSGFLNGHIKSIKYYPRRLSNDQLQELTQ